MDVWFELDALYPEHPKVLSLRRRLQLDHADVYPMRLMAYCARSARSGGIPAEEVEPIARWRGETGALLAALRAEKFLDPHPSGDDSMVVLHGWKERSGKALQKIEKRRKRDRARKAGGDDSSGIPAEFQRNSSGAAVPPSGGIPGVQGQGQGQGQGQVLEQEPLPTEGGPPAGAPPPKPKGTKKDGTPKKPPYTEGAAKLLTFFDRLMVRLNPSTRKPVPLDKQPGLEIVAANQLAAEYDPRRVAFAVVTALRHSNPRQEAWYRGSLTSVQHVRNLKTRILNESEEFWAKIHDFPVECYDDPEPGVSADGEHR